MRAITRWRGVVAAIAAATLTACGVTIDETSPLADPGLRSISVAPRVALDGLTELGARADRVVVDEVLFHAPTVVQRADGAVVADILDSDAPLLFRYDATDSGGFGNVLGGERTFSIDGAGDLMFGFEHFTADVPSRATLEGTTGVDLDELYGHTAVVHGYLLTSEGDGGSSTGFGTRCDGDPDGNPADCRDDTSAEGDPDGNPAEGDPDGNPAEGDPDGNPADESEGDPDGNPSQDPSSSGSGNHVDKAFAASSDALVGVHERGSFTPVPFFLVLDDSFALSVPVASVFAGDVSATEVVPIDLHVSLDKLLTNDLLHALDEQASDDVSGPIVIKVHASAALAIDVQAEGVTRVRQKVSSSGIRVTGDNR